MGRPQKAQQGWGKKFNILEKHLSTLSIFTPLTRYKKSTDCLWFPQKELYQTVSVLSFWLFLLHLYISIWVGWKGFAEHLFLFVLHSVIMLFGIRVVRTKKSNESLSINVTCREVSGLRGCKRQKKPAFRKWCNFKKAFEEQTTDEGDRDGTLKCGVIPLMDLSFFLHSTLQQLPALSPCKTLQF